MVKNIKAKRLLSRLSTPEGEYDPFGIKLNMNIYRGCQHQCIYCDSRSECYRIENFANVLVKKNALELLEKELRSKRKKATIGTGSMNDPYMPIERHRELTRGALKIINRYRFPVHILTKSDLVLRDTDILKQISRTYAAVSFTVTTTDDKLAKRLEPGAPPPSRRFEAINQLSRNGIYTGIVLTPVLPFLTDTPQNISRIVEKAKAAGAKYILAWMGMTLRQGQREYFYQKLDEDFPGIKEKYIARYADSYSCPVPAAKSLYRLLGKLCNENQIATQIDFYKETPPEQLNLFA